MEDLIILRGYIYKILYSNPEGWGTAIFSNEENLKLQIKIKGTIGNMKTKVLYEIHGHYENHIKYGKTFSVHKYKQAETNSVEQTIRFLSSQLFPGVGLKAAKLITDHYKTNVLAKIKQDYDSLFEIPGLDNKLAYIIKAQLTLLHDVERLTEIFFENDLKLDILNEVKKYTESDEETETIFKNNFYGFALRKKIKSFEEVDKVALYFGAEPLGPERVAFWTHRITTEILMNTGDTYTSKNVLFNKVAKVLNINDESIIIQGVLWAKSRGLLVLTDKKIYTKESYEDEEIIAKKLFEINHISRLVKPERLELLIDKVEKEIARQTNNKNFVYDEFQRSALKSFANNKFSVLTGGPGTGKTTVISGMVKLFNKVYNEARIAIAAPTGRAASRIRENSWELPATTIHKLLRASSNDEFEINAENPLLYQLIIVDESSMIENRLFSQFIQSIGNAVKVVVVGDVNQLPSVGFGNMFEDIIKVNKYPVTVLERIHRQEGGNGIIDLAYAIQSGTLSELDLENLPNVTVNFDAEPEQSVDTIKDIFKTLKETNSILDIQIISPVYAGEMGIENLNHEIQAEFNPNIMIPAKVYDRGRFRYSIGDKIMFLKNDSQLDLSNGDIGIIETIVNKNDKFENSFVNFGSNNANLETSNFNDVALSYACSVHKTQGSEYKKVILAIEPGRSAFFLNKKLLYTAITRAKDELYIIGDKELFLKASMRETNSRKTTLKEQIIAIENNL